MDEQVSGGDSLPSAVNSGEKAIRTLEQEGFGALLGVAQGSIREPRLIVLHYRGAGEERPVALVGKGEYFVVECLVPRLRDIVRDCVEEPQAIVRPVFFQRRGLFGSWVVVKRFDHRNRAAICQLAGTLISVQSVLSKMSS